MANEADIWLTREQTAYRAKVVAYVRELGATDNGRVLRDYIGFMLHDLRVGNDNADAAKVLKNQGGIAACVQMLDHLRPRAPETPKKDTDPRTPEERMASPDAGY